MEKKSMADLNTVSSWNQLAVNQYVTIYEQENAVKKILFVGNSITRHAPKAEIGWYGDWGMAASCKEKDYVHQVMCEVKKRTGNVSYCIAQASQWENRYFEGKEVLDAFYRAARDFEADIVVIRIGENINRETNKQICCKRYYEEMIRFFAKNPDAKVIVTDNFWDIEVLDRIFYEVCMENQYEFCRISDLGKEDENMALGLFEHHGVAMHPSDLGMKRIAERILEKIYQKEKNQE